ncbi:hypothetical protein CCS01_28520 [Rhodopila globiformis]|uniref:Uncharacterized protein n=2 Tax=Rhodopila globiformis TaxID=1071 RepID=A0A2S6MXI3_RHOGL|nr:hypothetical protein CCS01_28520 [Rhodopila globiformis]
MSGFGGNAAQNACLTRQAGLPDEWAFHQARTMQARGPDTMLLASLPHARDPATQAPIRDA